MPDPKDSIDAPTDGPTTRIDSQAATDVPRGGGPAITLPDATATDRYRIGRVIGRGGMGEVVAAMDTLIGREVAVKRLHSGASADSFVRFFREARVQGRLEHPAIVPVHEMAVDREGNPFFVMKRLSGTTLADILAAIRDGDTGLRQRFPRQRLLRAFADVCLAIEFAHKRGVVHRDLKPSNIMLGDFGEVYVLDWGIARVLDDAERISEPDITADPALDGELTQEGAILGTVGYMSPEQLHGSADLDGRADVFALGAILFEILAGSPLLAPTPMSVLAPEIDARPSKRAPERAIPPELDAACVAATAIDPTVRMASARELGDVVQRFLDGDRDLELRQRLARDLVAEAMTVLARADDEPTRRLAMQQAGRALALDPTAADAGALLSRLMLEPPKVTPPEVLDEVDQLDIVEGRKLNRAALGAGITYLLFVPILYWIGVRSVVYLGILTVATIANTLTTMLVTKYVERRPLLYFAVIVNAVVIAIVAWELSPFLVAPSLAAVTAMAFSFHPRLANKPIAWIVGTTAVLVPFALEATGVIAPTTTTTAAGQLVLDLPAVLVRSPHAQLALAFYTAVIVVLAGVLGQTLSRAQWNLRCQIQLQAWHLRQLVPVTRPSAA